MVKKLTWECLRTHEYLKEIYDSIPGLKRSPDPYSSDKGSSRSVQEEISDNQDEMQGVEEHGVSSEAQDPLDNPVKVSQMQEMFKSLDWIAQIAYMLTFGYGKYQYSDKEYPGPNVSYSTGTGTGKTQSPEKKGFGRFLPYAAVKRYGVSFEGEELSRQQIAELYIEPFFGKDGVDLAKHVRKTSPRSAKIKLRNELDVEKELDRLVHGPLEETMLSILELKHYQDRLTGGALKFLIDKGIIRSPIQQNVLYYSAYKNFGGASLRGIGLNVKPDLVIGHEAELVNGKELGIIAASLLGEVKFCSLEMRANFGNVKRLLKDRDSAFIKAVAMEEIPDVKKLAGQSGSVYQESLEGLSAMQARENASFPTDIEIARTGLSKTEFNKAVKLFSIITKLVTTGVHAGVPRVLLMDFNDYLFIELNHEFKRDLKFSNDQYFPEIVNCRYAIFHRSEEFVKLLICCWSLPTTQYTTKIEKFRKAVAEVLVIELKKKLYSIYRGGNKSTQKSPPSSAGDPSSFGGRPPATGYDGKRNSAKDPNPSSAPPTGGPPPSGSGATTYQAETEMNRNKAQMTREGLGNAGDFFSESDLGTLSSGLTSPTNSKRKLKKRGPPSEASALLTPPSSSSASSTTEYFALNVRACEYYSCVILADSLKKYIRHGEGYNSQTLLVDTELFSKYICNPNKVLEDPSGKSLLKVYDPYWADNTNAEPEDAFNHFNPILSDLCMTELKAYERLSPLMGEIVPTLYAYGTMLDVSVMIGQVYSRFTGPFLLMEHLKKKEGFGMSDVDEEFVKNKIIPAFEQLHRAGVVHNDIKWSNMIFTEDEKFKIIDFSHSVISNDKRKFREEIDKIWDWFKLGDRE